MKEKRKNEQAHSSKDYYSSVLLSQMLCCTLIVAMFFILKSSGKWNELMPLYSDLLKEDFLSENVDAVISDAAEYFSSDQTDLAVFNSSVEPYISTTIQETSAENKVDVFSQATLSDMKLEPVAHKKEATNLKLTSEQTIILPVVDGRYTSYFGERVDPISDDDDYHKGVDIGADEGDIIRAVYDGTVSLTGEDSHSGKYIFLTHENGYVTFYCHCSEILAEEGAVISQGETIALVGSTGYSTGPHLHFEVRVDGESIDPLPLLENAV